VVQCYSPSSFPFHPGRRGVLALATAPLLGRVGAASAQGSERSWPSREISVLVGYGAGGATDLMCRAVAGHLSAVLKVPVNVRNLPGGAGTIAPARLATMRPDGYTIGHLGIGALNSGPLMMDVPYKPWEAFTFLAGAGELRFGVCAGPSLAEVKSLPDLIEVAKRRRVTFCQSNPISATAMFDLARLTGGQFEYVQFPSITDGLAQVAGGHLDLAIGSSEILGLVKSGDLRLLASASADRWPDFPGTPTLREFGYEAVSRTPSGFGAPAGLPEPIRARLEAALEAAVRSPEVTAQLGALGIVPLPLGGAAFRAMMQDIEPSVARVLRLANMLRAPA
jgi:tripartite-type tricarboxylate transporter receptor subunit TctC